jgi:hypothetical protein
MKNKEFLEINLSQFGVWKHFQIIYLLFIFNFLLLIDYWASDNWARFYFYFFFRWLGSIWQAGLTVTTLHLFYYLLPGPKSFILPYLIWAEILHQWISSRFATERTKGLDSFYNPLFKIYSSDVVGLLCASSRYV